MHKKSGFQYRIYPTRAQETALNKTLSECCWLYNHFLEEHIAAFNRGHKTPTLYDQNNTLKTLKQERPSLRTMHSQILQDVSTRVDIAFKGFFRRCKAKEKPGFPRFMGIHRYNSFCYPQSGFKLNGDTLYLSKIGDVKIIFHRPIEGKVKICSIRRSYTGKWFVGFCTEQEIDIEPVSGMAIGIDVGLTTFATLSDASTVEAPRFFRSEEKEVSRAHRSLSKHPKGSYERNKKRKILSRIHERVANKRKNFAHQNSRRIIDHNTTICVEDLAVNRLVHNRCLAKSIYDASWAQFTRLLEYKAEWAGKRVVRVNPAYTSQTCSGCGHRQKMRLDQRRYMCSCCGLSLDRDHNAALNILALGLQSIGRETEKAPRGE